MPDAFPDLIDDDSDPDANSGSSGSSVNLQAADSSRASLLSRPSPALNLSQGSTDPLVQRLGQAMQSIVADPDGSMDEDPSTDPWVGQLRGSNPAPNTPGLLSRSASVPSQPIIGTDSPFQGPNDPRLDSNLATDGDGQIEDIGGRNATLRRQWSLQKGLPWPTDPVTGRNHDVAHIVAKADGGADTVDNIQPMHPLDHRQQHKANGDFARWAKRRWFGNEMIQAPPTAETAAAGEAASMGETAVRGLGLLQIIPDITGILSGRIRTNNWNNFVSDMFGVPSEQDVEDWYRKHPPRA